MVTAGPLLASRRAAHQDTKVNKHLGRQFFSSRTRSVPSNSDAVLCDRASHYFLAACDTCAGFQTTPGHSCDLKASVAMMGSGGFHLRRRLRLEPRVGGIDRVIRVDWACSKSRLDCDTPPFFTVNAQRSLLPCLLCHLSDFPFMMPAAPQSMPDPAARRPGPCMSSRLFVRNNVIDEWKRSAVDGRTNLYNGIGIVPSLKERCVADTRGKNIQP